jgi:hypothetical protein
VKKIIPRRAYDPSIPGYMESDKDYIDNNHDAVIEFLDGGVVNQYRKQQLVDLVFDVALMSTQYWCDSDRDQHTEWIRQQLSKQGFKTKPMGSSHGVLIDE